MGWLRLWFGKYYLIIFIFRGFFGWVIFWLKLTWLIVSLYGILFQIFYLIIILNFGLRLIRIRIFSIYLLNLMSFFYWNRRNFKLFFLFENTLLSLHNSNIFIVSWAPWLPINCISSLISWQLLIFSSISWENVSKHF